MPKDTFFNLSEEKREKVIRSAVSEFLKHGFEKANVGSIAKNAGVAKGSIYQYFENKKELFGYSVRWSVELLTKKSGGLILTQDKNIFDYFYQSSNQLLEQFRQEREMAIFIQDVFLGRYPGMTDESTTVMMKAADEFVMHLIKEGKKNGSIRKDMDDKILSLFLLGATTKIKENILSRARSDGADIIDAGFDKYDSDIKAMIELIKNGMGEKTCS